jgi:hypothetical protein
LPNAVFRIPRQNITYTCTNAITQIEFGLAAISSTGAAIAEESNSNVSATAEQTATTQAANRLQWHYVASHVH